MMCYDPRGMDWNLYCNLMAELFPTNSLGYYPEDKWRDWVTGLQGISLFVQNAIPSEHQCATWQEWASQMAGIMVLDYVNN